MKDPFEFIDIVTIKKEGIVPYSEETIRRYFRQRVLHIHKRKDEDGTSILSYRGSVKIRFETFKKIARQNKLKRLPIEDAGVIISQASGKEDGFIVGRLKKKVPLPKISKDFVEKINKILE